MALDINKLKSKYLNLLSGTQKKVGGYFDPTSNAGNNFWSSPVAKGVGNVQRAGNFLVKNNLVGFNTSPGLIGVDSSKGFVNGRVQQKVSPIPQINEVNRNITNYVQNRYVQPVRDLPKNITALGNKNLSWQERGMGGLGAVGGLATLFPDPIQDVAMPIYDYAKGARSSYLRGGDTKQNVMAGMQSLTLEKPVGLGTAFTTNPTGEMAGNLAELPLTLLGTAKLGKGMNIGYDKKIVDKFGILIQDPVIRNALSEFSTIVETTGGKKNLGENARLVQSVLSDLFGGKSANLTNKQTKNLIDILWKQSNDPGLFHIKKINPGGSITQSAREGVDAQAGLYDAKSLSPEIISNRLGIRKETVSSWLNKNKVTVAGLEKYQLQPRELENLIVNDLPLRMGTGTKRMSLNEILSTPLSELEKKNVAQQPIGDAKTTLYRGTSDKGGTGFAAYGKGTYLTDNKAIAQSYAGKNGKITEQDLGKVNLLDAEKYRVDGKVKNFFKDQYLQRGFSNNQATKALDDILNFARKNSKDIKNYRGELEYVAKQVGLTDASTEQLSSIIKSQGFDGIKYLSAPEIEGAKGTNYVLYNKQQPLSVPSTVDNIGQSPRTSQLDTVEEILSERAKNTQVPTPEILQSKTLPQISRPSTYRNITLKDVENKIYGDSPEIKALGENKSVGLLGDQLRKVERLISARVSAGLTSNNKTVRLMANAIQDLSGGAGKSGEQITARMNYRGGIDYGTKVASDAQNKIYNILGNDPKSLERVHSVLDPDISKVKVKESDLTPQELEAAGILRVVSDFINDTNYKLGFISKEKWQSNQGGKYIARAYEDFDYPPEVADFVKDRSIKFDLNPFKTRGEVTDWKMDNAIRDPAYLMGKRLQQTMFNQEVRRYMDWAKGSGLTSDVASPGFVQLSDSKSYGDLAGKYIRKDALEDVKGFFASNDIAQKAYDVLNWYDRNPIRRNLKALKTVFNPAVRLGNKTGNYVFAWLNGINPATFTKNKSWAKGAIQKNDPLYRYATQRGLMGTDVTKADIARVSAELKNGVADKNIIQKIDEWAKESYGRVDDNSKLAALKTWMDRGIDPDEAINRVQRGFQDYNMVGMLYDIGAKLPVLGNPFVRFASESVRIAKNAVVDHPIRTIASVAAWKLFTDAMSRMSSETEEDRQTREQRVGAAHLPFTDISTNVQTPWGEVNVSRLLGFSTTFTPEDSTYSDLSKYSPIQNPMDARNYGSDPLIGPLISLGMDKDFRGKSIADPNQNKYTGSTLTPIEQNVNRAGYVARSYLPPSATDAFNIGKAVQGEPNVYGQTKTPTQAILRTFPGVKVEQFGAKEAGAARERNAYFDGLKQEANEKKANSVTKQLLEGKITPDQAQKRVGYFLNQGGDTTVKQVGNGVVKVGSTYKYLDDKGNQQTIDMGQEITKPTLTGDALYDKKLMSKYSGKITSQQNDIIKLAELGVISKDEAIKAVNSLEKLRVKKARFKKLTAPKIKIKKISFKTPKIKVKKLKRSKSAKIKIKKIKI